MNTECQPEQIEFHGLGKREVIGKFDGGRITSDAGGLLLREVENRSHILKRLSQCFTDYRHPELVEHSLESLIKQRIYGLALGYEDLSDHDELRQDALLALLCDKTDITGADRVRQQDKGKALAGKSTRNRLELTSAHASTADRYKKIVAHPAAMDRLLMDLFVESHEEPPEQIVLDVDATDDPVHGSQEGRFFHGYYGHYCYLPLYIFSDEDLLCALLRPSNQDGAAGTQEEVRRIVGELRKIWPEVQIIVRGDGGFCRESLMGWCENNRVDYVFGLPKNDRLKTEIQAEMTQARRCHEATGEAARVFKDFCYRTLKSWSCERRVIGKAEYLSKGENPRFIVTSITDRSWDARALYEDFYCARGDMENRIKEQQLGLFADRTSTHEMRANQLRLYFSSFAYVLMQTLRRLGLKETPWAKAQATTIRLKIFKIGALLRVSVRKVWIAFSESYPYRDSFHDIWGNLMKIPIRN
ncbi:MAG: IS1380 family transposase [Candidatus Thiodiazotropha weberae]|nr:IS1380 family transposase [Candidatus Thiodiazotropha lotti]MCG8012337.1 IS1380 family transposase [Candidatus Thiodiazotropha lotti]MCG8022310.1 IS1380 family transposase [Candidatus Thiodiazotropha lotti]MCW4209485.1 IS1380 family transposase [Candidatus Thiodiazotropha lotti]MCW4211807.1 IS1380 family transposase [Candidatus Thiodiazotropha lotti]